MAVTVITGAYAGPFARVHGGGFGGVGGRVTPSSQMESSSILNWGGGLGVSPAQN